MLGVITAALSVVGSIIASKKNKGGAPVNQQPSIIYQQAPTNYTPLFLIFGAFIVMMILLLIFKRK